MSTSVSDTTKSSRRDQRSSAQTFIDNLKGMAHPNSRRIFIQGSRPDIRVPLREIQLADTFVGGTKEAPQFEPNEPVPVYDTSGPYGEEAAPSTCAAACRACARSGCWSALTPKRWKG